MLMSRSPCRHGAMDRMCTNQNAREDRSYEKSSVSIYGAKLERKAINRVYTSVVLSMVESALYRMARVYPLRPRPYRYRERNNRMHITIPTDTTMHPDEGCTANILVFGVPSYGHHCANVPHAAMQRSWQQRTPAACSRGHPSGELVGLPTP